MFYVLGAGRGGGGVSGDGAVRVARSLWFGRHHQAASEPSGPGESLCVFDGEHFRGAPWFYTCRSLRAGDALRLGSRGLANILSARECTA